MRYEHARRQGGMAVREALLHTTTHVAIGNLTAASTLALAFFAGIFADFKAVAELGWIAGCGVLLCAFACFTLLPALLTVYDRRGLIAVSPPLRLFDPGAPPLSVSLPDDSWLPWLRRRPATVLALGGALAVVVGVGTLRARYDHNLLHLQAEKLESVRWQMTLLQHTTGASWHALSYRRTREEALALAEQYRRLPEVSQVIEVAAMVPPDQDRKMPLVADIHRRLRKLPRADKPIRQVPTDIAQMRSDLNQVLAALATRNTEERGGGGGLFAEVRVALTRLNHVLEHVGDERATGMVQAFDEHLATDLCANLHKLRSMATPRPIELSDLPEGLRERYVGKNGAWLLRVFARADLWDFEPLEEFTSAVQKVDAEATGKPFTTHEGLKAMKNGLLRAGAYAFIVIVLVLWLDFRGLGRTLLAILPLLLGVLLSVGILAWCGVPLNPANMIAFPLILGVGVDNGVHVLHDYLIRRKEGRHGVSRAIGRGVLVKALTTMIGFSALMISTERGLVGLGLILTLGVGCSMLSALVFLPAGLELLGPPPPPVVSQRPATFRQEAA
jgi:hypothetical protein